MKKMTLEQKAWLAGLWEGEGSVTIVRPKPHLLQLHVTIGMTDEDVLRHVAAITGLGKVYGPYKPLGSLGKKPRWFWKVVVTHDAYDILKVMQPYLFKRRTSKVIEAISAVDHHVPMCKNGLHPMVGEAESLDYRGYGRCQQCYENAKKRKVELQRARRFAQR